MFKILIVEDEPYERLGLKEQISATYDPDNIRVAGSVEEAIDAVNSWVPDLILLDIRLKGKSGFEVARYVKKEYPAIEIIIITAYNEFEYARKALGFRINYYLSKPVRPSLLMETIRDALHKNKDSAVSLQQSIWPLLETGQHSKAESSIGFDVHTVLVAAFEKPQGRLHEYMNFIYTYLDKGKKKIELMKNRCIVYLDCDYEHLTSVLESLCSHFENKFGSKMVFGAGQSDGTMTDCYLRGITACNHKIFYPHISILEFEGMEKGRENQCAYPLTDEQKLLNMARRGSTTELEGMLHQLVEVLISSSGRSYPVLRTWVEGLYNSLKRLCITEGILSNEISIIEPEQFWFSAECLEKDIGGFIQRISRMLEGRTRIEHPVIAKAVDYMLEHYNEDITLPGLSRKLSISSGYFSRLFKEEVGTPFRNYLIGIRMDRAKKLLLKSGVAVSEVAVEVGYSDPNYFSEAFKKYEGISPSEYREMNGVS